MGDDPHLPRMPQNPTLGDFFDNRFAPANHLLQSATHAAKAGQDEETVLACLLHDVGVFSIARSDHGYWGAQLVEPYVSERVSWAIRYHQALRFYPDLSVGYDYPEAYIRYFGKDYEPEPYVRKAAEYAKTHKMRATRDVMTYEQEDGLRASYSYYLPTKPEDLLLRRANTEVWVREVFGMCGRLPDFCASMVVGYYDIRGELADLDPALAANTESYLSYARDHDLCLSHALHDPCMDKSLRPSQDPDRCVRVVKERDDGIIVRGARFNTLGLFSNEILVSPTYFFTEDEPEFALWFTIPVNAPGLKQIARELYGGRNPLDHPVSSRFDEVDSLVVFDDVFVPWERIFLYRQPLAANRLFRGNVMNWAAYAGTLLTQMRMEILIAVGHLLAKTSGMDTRPHVVQALGEMCTYLSLLRSNLEAAERAAVTTPGGHVKPRPAPERRSLVTMISESFVELVEHIGTSSLIFLPNAEDWNAPEVKKHLDVYLRGRDTSPKDRYKLCKLAWELTGEAYGSRQHPNMMVANAYRNYDLSEGVDLVSEFLDLEGAT